jgi:hypothetical protein
MHAAVGPEWALALEHSALGEAMRGGILLYPAVETSHVLGLATLVGSILVLDFRLLGFGQGIKPEALAALAIPVAAVGFLIAVCTGVPLFVTEAAAYVRNPAFLTKIGLIAFGLVNIALFHWRLRPGLRDWPANKRLPGTVRLSAGLSAAIWILVPVCGRLIAYV